MKLEDFIKELESDVQKFHKHWIEHRQARVEKYGDADQVWPLEMEGGEWFEQFLAYIQMEYDDDF